MDDLLELLHKVKEFGEVQERRKEQYLAHLCSILMDDVKGGQSTVTPIQIKKRAKRLTSLEENEDEDINSKSIHVHEPRKSSRTSNHMLLDIAASLSENDNPRNLPVATVEPIQKKSVDSIQMPPPPAPLAATNSALDETSCGRPQRAAKLKSEKNLKEPTLKNKLRRPSNTEVQIKLEEDNRLSQMHNSNMNVSKSSTNSARSDASICILPSTATAIVELESEDEQNVGEANSNQNQRKLSNLCIKIKREKVSILESEASKLAVLTTNPSVDESLQPPKIVPMPTQIKVEPSDETSTTILSATSSNITTANNKKGRKKKECPRPIKVERFSDIDTQSPISSRTRKGSLGREKPQQEDKPRNGSIYEDATDQMPINSVNETVNLGEAMNSNATMNFGAAPADATYCTAAQTTFQVAPAQTTFVMDNPNATVTISQKSNNEGDATFNVAANKNGKNSNGTQRSLSSTRNTMETAKDSSPNQNDSLITEDESFEKRQTAIKKNLPKIPTSAKAYQMPMRTKELFNPLIQSPVKKKVEAFENVAATVDEPKTLRSKKAKENAAMSHTTPVIGKLPAPALGRFLTPTQSSNITPNCMATQNKKITQSASKASGFPKTTTTTTKGTLSRENSGDDFRKGLHQMAEERKKQREMKHMQAAQLREQKEKERAERLAKANKEREEKRLLKAESEQKKRELEEIRRKLKQQEEAEAAAKKKQLAAKQKAILEQERELLKAKEASKTRMLPPPPKVQAKYTFEMLHEDDSTDDEAKTSYKRPPPPTWSRKHVRGPAIQMQQYQPTCIIDSLFSVQPTTPDLKVIFPNIDARYLKRNSSVLWSTPPRYSELPKY